MRYALVVLCCASVVVTGRESWDYTALGDSIATGYLAPPGYVGHYADHVRSDTGAEVSLYNLAQNGRTSAQLLASFQDSKKGPSIVRTSVSQSELVTWNIGLNDFRNARTAYQNGKCGGKDNQSCLATMLSGFQSNWDGILTQILMLRGTHDTILRTMDIYNPWVASDAARNTIDDSKEPAHARGNDLVVLGYYLTQMNTHIAQTAASRGIPVALVQRAFNGETGTDDPATLGLLASDGLHPNATGHAVIADLLKQIGYAPLR